MCGRYWLSATQPELVKIIAAAQQKTITPVRMGDIFPGNVIAVICEHNNKLQVLPMVWGLPSYAGNLLINARLENALQRKTWQFSLHHQRCLIPASGFYEWSKDKNKYLFSFAEHTVFCIAGIYLHRWVDGIKRSYAVMMTTVANQQVNAIHHRMPVVLAGDWRSDESHHWLLESRPASLPLFFLNRSHIALQQTLIID